MKQLAWAVLAVLALTLSVVPAAAQDSLQWKLVRGEKVNYLLTQEMDTTVETGGATSATNMVLSMQMSWDVQGVAANGDSTMNQVIDRVTMRMQGGPAGTVEFDTQNSSTTDSPQARAMAGMYSGIVNKEFLVTMKPTGKVESVQIPKEMALSIQQSTGSGRIGLTEDMLKQMMKQNAVTLPSGPVAPGQKWSTSQLVKLPAVTIEMAPEMTYHGRDKATNYAVVSIVPNITMKTPDGASLPGTSSSGKGVMYFDVDRGRVVKMQLNMTTTTQSRQSEQSVVQTVNQKTTMTLAR